MVDNYGLSDYLVDNLCCGLGFPPFVCLRVGLVLGSVDNRLKIRLKDKIKREGLPVCSSGRIEWWHVIDMRSRADRGVSL